MRIVYEYSHLGGSEIMKVRYPEWDAEINAAIAAVEAHRTMVNQEEMEQEKLYSPAAMIQQFRDAFGTMGYREWQETYTFALPYNAGVAATISDQFNFVKGGVLIEVQFGCYESVFYDLVKFQRLFDNGKCTVGVEIVPCYALHEQMSGNASFGEQLIHDIERLKPHAPVVPVKVILIDA